MPAGVGGPAVGATVGDGATGEAGPRPEGWTGRAKGHPDYTASRYLNMVTYGLEQLGPGHLDYVVGLYDAGLRKLDDDLAALFGQLERRQPQAGARTCCAGLHACVIRSCAADLP